jgi:hypothetical protein
MQSVLQAAEACPMRRPPRADRHEGSTRNHYGQNDGLANPLGINIVRTVDESHNRNASPTS